MICENVTITNKLGMHARASAKFVQLSSSYDCDINLTRDGQTVNGKSIMGIMMLAASKGTEIKVCTDGDDEAQAMEALLDLINDRFGEDE
jgi:phosphocarrier protein HPr